jgi:hypothetical protein
MIAVNSNNHTRHRNTLANLQHAWKDLCNPSSMKQENLVLVNLITKPKTKPVRTYLRMITDRQYGLVVRVSGYRSRGPGFDYRRFQILWEAAGLEWGPLSLVRTTEELLEGNVAAPVYETEINDRGNPLRWPRDTLYPKKLALFRQQAAVARSVYFARGPKPWSLVLVTERLPKRLENYKLRGRRSIGRTIARWDDILSWCRK